MKTSTLAKTLGVLALLGSSASMAATVTITASTLAPTVGQNFTLTVAGDVSNFVAATMGLSFNASTVAYVSGVALAPFNVFVKNSPTTANPTVFDIETPTAVTGQNNYAQLTFTALAAGAANIVINDDGGSASGFFDANTADYIANVSYTQADVVVQGAAVPAPAAVWLLGTGVAALGFRAARKRAA